MDRLIVAKRLEPVLEVEVRRAQRVLGRSVLDPVVLLVEQPEEVRVLEDLVDEVVEVELLLPTRPGGALDDRVEGKLLRDGRRPELAA